MAPIVSYNISTEDFKNLLAETVRVELQALNILKEKNEEKLFSRKEVAEKFGISLTTLNTWVQNEVIPTHKVNGSSRVYFKWKDIQAALENKPKYKRQK